MFLEPKIELYNLVLSLSEALDLFNSRLTHHQKRVAYISVQLAYEMGLDNESVNDILYAGVLHDIALCSSKEKERVVVFEAENPFPHMRLGRMMLKDLRGFSVPAEIIGCHHVLWEEGRGKEFEGRPVPLASHIIHLADRLEVLIDSDRDILAQAESILETIKSFSGSMFMPAVVRALESIAKKEYFWLDIVSPRIYSIMMQLVPWPMLVVGLNELEDISRIYAHIIDFKSPWTVTHSSGVAASSRMLSKLAGFSERERRLMTMAGHLHDLGKLSIPEWILNKPAKLNAAEYRMIRTHTYHTYHILNRIQDLSTVSQWAAFHHERLDGTGYPFHLTGADISLGSRIVAVADIFTAITEDRPYRKGMSKNKIMEILSKMADSSDIDRDITDILFQNYDEIDAFRTDAQKHSQKIYRQFFQENSQEASHDYQLSHEEAR